MKMEETKTLEALENGGASMTLETTANLPKSQNQKRRKGNKGNKKQKLNNGESKTVTDFTREHKKKKYTLSEDEVKVTYQAGRLISAEILQKMFNECEHVKILNNSTIVIKYKPGVASKKLEELRKIEIEGTPVYVSVKTEKCSLKKIIRLSNIDPETVKEFYNPKSFEVLMKRDGDPSNNYILTFETDEEAKAASVKKFDSGDKMLHIRPFWDQGQIIKPYEDVKEQVKSKNEAEKETPSKTKPAKNAQVKRKAEEEEVEKEGEESDVDAEDDDMDDDGETGHED